MSFLRSGSDEESGFVCDETTAAQRRRLPLQIGDEFFRRKSRFSENGAKRSLGDLFVVGNGGAAMGRLAVAQDDVAAPLVIPARLPKRP